MQTPGEILKHQRKKLGKTIFEISQETKILEKYIKQIENNQFDKFDSPVFARGFTKIYAQYLGLDVEKLLALFRRENKEIAPIKKRRKKFYFNFKSVVTSTNLTILSTIIFFLFIIIYFSFLYFNFQKQPELLIFTPVNGYISDKEKVVIEGDVSKNISLTINNKTIQYEKEHFKYNFVLFEGENNIEVKASNPKNDKKYTTTILNVSYKPIKEESVPADPQTLETFKIQLKIKNDSTWIKLIIDEDQIYAQVLKSGFSSKFTAKKSMEIVSGKPDNTVVLINGERRDLIINKDTGVASITCSLKDSQINCTK